MNKLYLFFLASTTFIFFSLNANTVNKPNIGFDKHESEFGALEYRLIGPFRGGRSAAVTGVLTNLIFIILELREVEYGKHKMAEINGKIFLMVFLEEVLVL